MARVAMTALVGVLLAGCLPDLSVYEVEQPDRDGGMRQPGAQLPPPQDCSAPIPIGLGFRDGFEGGTNGWGAFAEGGRPSWEIGAPVDPAFVGSPGGGAVIATGLGLAYPPSETSYLVSPCFDASAATGDLLLSFSRTVMSEQCCDRASVEVSVDGGDTWSPVSGQTRLGWYSSSGFSGEEPWGPAAVLLPGTAGQRAVQVRFKWRTDTSANGAGFAIDDFELREATTDLALEITEADRCGYVDATVTNIGGLPVTGYEVITDVDGVMDVQSFDTQLAYLQDRELELGEGLAFQLSARVFTAGDTNTDNDQRSFVFSEVPFGMGYFNDFETDEGMIEVTGDNPSWEIGAPAGEVIDTAASGARAWVTNLSGPYNRNERSHLRLPCMDFSALAVDPVISFSRVYRTEGCCDFARVEVSVDGGSFSTVGSSSSSDGIGWYNDSRGWGGSSGAGTWDTASHPLRNTAGARAVRVRIRFGSDGSQEFDGFGLDDLTLSPGI